jgi:hypothetical protein
MAPCNALEPEFVLQEPSGDAASEPDGLDSATVLVPGTPTELGTNPALGGADAGFYSREAEKEGHALGVRWMSVPNKNTAGCFVAEALIVARTPRIIGVSHTPSWLASGWECRGRRLSRG